MGVMKNDLAAAGYHNKKSSFKRSYEKYGQGLMCNGRRALLVRMYLCYKRVVRRRNVNTEISQGWLSKMVIGELTASPPMGLRSPFVVESSAQRPKTRFIRSNPLTFECCGATPSVMVFRR